MIRAVFTDIDGTLKNSKREVTEHTKDVLRKCKEENLQVILVSGRSREYMTKFKEGLELSNYLISSNGADIYDSKEDITISSNHINKVEVRILYEYAKQNGYRIKFNYEDKMVVNKAFHPDDIFFIKKDEDIVDIINKKEIVQCVVMDSDFNKMKEFRQYFHAHFRDLKIENESKRLIDENLPEMEQYYCDIINRDVSKGQAVEKLARKLYGSTTEIATVGDGENDISMFKTTYNSVAMGNASQYVKGFANYQTKSNDDEGLAYMLETILEKNKSTL